MRLYTDADYSNNMILQRGTANKLCGGAEPGSEVSLTVSGSSGKIFQCSVKADESGRFAAALPEFEGGQEEYSITLESAGESLVISRVLFGDVFHITGQSNMELPLMRIYDPFDDSKPFSGDKRLPDCPYIREFRAPVVPCFDPETVNDRWSSGKWTRADEPDAAYMSAAGYFFAKVLFDRYGIPVGLVNTSAGGSPVEGRMSCEELRELGGYDGFLDRVTAPGWLEKTSAEDLERTEAYYKMLDENDRIGRRVLACDFPEGEEVTLPYWKSGFCGRLWLWRDVDIPEEFDKDSAMLLLGTLTDSDRAYINGVQVGETGYMYPPRYYAIPAGVLKNGQNRIAVRLDIYGGEGGFTEGKRWCIKSGRSIIDLTCGWRAAESVRADRLRPAEFFQGLPLALYGVTTAPAYGKAFRGLIVYQGESNGHNAGRYKELFTHFISTYRRRCGWEIPVIWAQLPEFGHIDDDSWAVIRQAQLECAGLANTAMAVTVGLGESNDLHPINKWEVGRRLALCAERLIFEGRECRPVSFTQHITDDALILTFDRDISLLGTDGSYFDAVYPGRTETVRAEQISADTVVIRFSGDTPEAVRYAWRSCPDKPQLFDSEGLPVSPFICVLKQ